MKGADVIVSTFEKWEAFTRNADNYGIAKSIGLLLIDEFHVIGESRGAFLEATLLRMKRIGVANLRIVAVSATVPNLFEIGDWINQKLFKTKSFQFEPSFRPVALELHVLGIEKQSSYLQSQNEVNVMLQRCINTYSNFKSTLVVKIILLFCSSVHHGKMPKKQPLF